MVSRTSGLFVLLLVTSAIIFVSCFQYGSKHVSIRHSRSLCMANDDNELNGLTVVELKARLKAKGLIVSGLKKDLIERLTSSNDGETSRNVKEEKLPVPALKKVSKDPVSIPKDTVKVVRPILTKQTKHEPAEEEEDDFLSQLMAEGDEILREDRQQNPTSSSVRSSTSSSSSSSSTRRSGGSGSSSGSVNVEEIQRLCDQRNELRYHRDYDGADAVRDRLENEFGLKIFDFKNEWVRSEPCYYQIIGYMLY